MSSISKRRRENTNCPYKAKGDHDEFLNRITKSFYYGKLPTTERLSLPMSELAAELFSEAHRGHSLQRLQVEGAAEMSRNACMNPCALVLAMFYLDRLKNCDPDYLKDVAPSELFLVSLMVASKFLHDDGSDDSDVFLDEWATSGGISVQHLKQLEWKFLYAIEWKIFVSTNTFWSQLHSLEQSLAWRQGTKRGWYSYQEMSLLMPSLEIARLLLCATGILALTYTAGVLSLAGAMFITSKIPGTALRSPTMDIQVQVLGNIISNETCNKLQTVNQDNEIISFDILTDGDFNSTFYNMNKINDTYVFPYWLDLKPAKELFVISKETSYRNNEVPIWKSSYY